MSQVQGSGGNVLAALASFFIPGLGQLIQGRLVPAIVHFVLTVILWFFLVGWIMHIASILDAAKWNPKPSGATQAPKVNMELYQKKKTLDEKLSQIRITMIEAEDYEGDQRDSMLDSILNDLNNFRSNMDSHLVESEILEIEMDIDRLRS